MCLKFYWCVMHWLWVSFRFVPGCSYFGKGARNVNIVARVPGSLKKFTRFNISTELWASPVQCNCAVQYYKQYLSETTESEHWKFGTINAHGCWESTAVSWASIYHFVWRRLASPPDRHLWSFMKVRQIKTVYHVY